MSSAVQDRGTASGNRWRAFGLGADLAIDFADADRPAVVSQVLEGCAADAEAPCAPWQLTLGQRVEALLGILEATQPGSPLELRLRCPACGAALELALWPDALREHARAKGEGTQREVVLASGRTMLVRRPTGDDQRRWRARAYGDTASMIADLVTSVVVAAPDAAWAPDDLDRLSSAMEEFDPLAAFAVDATCAECGVATRADVDLEGAVLARLQACQRSMILEVHRLAERYGWTEQEVLAIPRRRRIDYLRLIEEGTGLP